MDGWKKCWTMFLIYFWFQGSFGGHRQHYSGHGLYENRCGGQLWNRSVAWFHHHCQVFWISLPGVHADGQSHLPCQVGDLPFKEQVQFCNQPAPTLTLCPPSSPLVSLWPGTRACHLGRALCLARAGSSWSLARSSLFTRRTPTCAKRFLSPAGRRPESSRDDFIIPGCFFVFRDTDHTSDTVKATS